MLNQRVNNQAPLFYSQPTTVHKTSVKTKVHNWLINWRIDQLQARINDIQAALDYEMRQNHSKQRLRELTNTAHEMCLILAHKQQRLLQR